MELKNSGQIDRWISFIRELGERSGDKKQTKLANRLSSGTDDREHVLKELNTIGLPVYERIQIPLKEFLDDPDVTLDEFDHLFYYATLNPRNLNLQRHSKTGLSRQDLTRFIGSRIDTNMIGKYDLILQEFEENVYGGTIVSNGDMIHIEMCEGKQSGVSFGYSNVITGTKTGLSFRYSTDDPEIRKIMWDVLQHIRLNESSERQVDLRFRKGYFEFALTRTPIRPNLRLVFFDYQTSEVYTNLSRKV